MLGPYKDRKTMAFVLGTMALFFLFPLLNFNESLRLVFDDWTPVAIEAALLILLLLALAAASFDADLSDPDLYP